MSKKVKRISKKEFERMGGIFDFRKPQSAGFEFVGLQKVQDRFGKLWVFTLFKKARIEYAIIPENYPPTGN